MRTFIAIEIDEALRQALATFQRALQRCGAQVRWVRPEVMHLTLAFFGETPEPGLAQIRAAMDLCVKSTHAFTLDVCGAGTFGSRRASLEIEVLTKRASLDC